MVLVILWNFQRFPYKYNATTRNFQNSGSSETCMHLFPFDGCQTRITTLEKTTKILFNISVMQNYCMSYEVVKQQEC